MRMIELLRKNTPAWLIFVIDLLIVLLSGVLAYLLRFNFEIPEWELRPMPYVIGYILLIRFIGFVIGKTNTGIIRYTSTPDVFRLLIVMFAGSVFFAITNIFTWFFFNEYFFIPFSIIIIEFIASTFGIAGLRIIVKIAYMEITQGQGHAINVAIFGAGEAGVLTKRVLERDTGSKLKVAAFIDDDPNKAGKKIEGAEIFKTTKLEGILVKKNIQQLIISVQKLETDKKQQLIEICLEKGVKILNVPPIMQWINGELSFKQLKEIRIQDLLERDVIRLEEENIRKELGGKTILISGGSGSIGSELARQVTAFSPGKVILLDQAETPLFHFELECLEKNAGNLYEFLVADICNEDRLREIFSKHKPHIIFHAAAYKHVPVMEQNPHEAVETNVRGSKVIADLAVEYGVDKFIMISTDKAVNPTSIMGASKRMAEIYTQSLDAKGKTKFITTRFGNVLGSNGSVVPLFKKQIEKGGPITITHPEITRYFMTIPEACQLVLEASAMGKGGEIYIFDMGKSVKIVELAQKMIKLYGLEIGKDIQIKFMGLRPGEKLYEELLNDKENTIPTHHPRILIAKTRKYDSREIREQINRLIVINNKSHALEVVKTMKKIVPEFRSKNSVYEQLDPPQNVE